VCLFYREDPYIEVEGASTDLIESVWRSPGVFSRYRIYIFRREEGSLSCLRLTQGVITVSTTRLYSGYIN
jgi:hypothetical protein